jgi:penicillin-binding protein 1A
MNILFRVIRRTLIGLFALSVVAVIVGAAYLESTLPSVEMLKDMRLQVPLRVFSSDGKLIAEFGEARRTPITLDQVPQDLINAILSTEDRRFYDHAGVDLRGLIRATFHVLTNVAVTQGGSTITMQVARNYFLTRKKTFVRKFSEILLALKIEKEFTKNEILELYLNKIYFGKRAYGIAAAAEVYYGTTVDKLTLDQIAMIAGLPQAPSSLNPLHDKNAAYKRRKHVLERMLAFGFITQHQYDAAIKAPLPTHFHGRTIELDAPYAAEMVRQELFDRYGEAVYTLGYEVTTTIDSQDQTSANYALRRALLEYDQRHGFRNRNRVQFKIDRNKKPDEMIDEWEDQLSEIPAYGNLIPGVVTRNEGSRLTVLLQNGEVIQIPSNGYSWTGVSYKMGDVLYAYQTWDQKSWRVGQIPNAAAAFVALQPESGAILAIVGGFDYNLSNFNRAAQAERQPGSSFKPFLYAAALSEGYTLASVFNDAPVSYTDPVTGVTWSPKNASGRFYGPTRLRVALFKSQNLVTVRVLQAIGIPTAIDFIERFGFNREKMPPVYSLALGVSEFTPLQMAAGYAVFANGGNRVTPYLIKKIKDYDGNVVDELAPPAPVSAISPQIAYLITSALQDAIQKGTAQRAKVLNRSDMAGKTGTTNDWYDAWFSGYNRDIVATAWVGFDEPKSLREYGGVAALPMWIYFMQQVLKDKPEHPPLMPPGIVTVKIDPSSGHIAHGQSGVYEVFTEETVPSESRSNYEGGDSWDWENNGGNRSSDSLF